VTTAQGRGERGEGAANDGGLFGRLGIFRIAGLGERLNRGNGDSVGEDGYADLAGICLDC